MAKRRTPAEGTSLGDDLRQAIAESGQSHYAIAKATGVAQPVITRFVNGTRSISLETAGKLAIFFGMKLTCPRQPQK